MKQSLCPCCQEAFEQDRAFCKTCGLRKSRPFSRGRWWLLALLLNLLLMVLVVVLRENMLRAKELPVESLTYTACLGLGTFGLLLFLPTLCFSKVWRILWLRRYGAITSGKVAEYRWLSAPKSRKRKVAIVKFRTGSAQQITYEAQHRAWWEALPLKKKVQVLYDPYAPRSIHLAVCKMGLSFVLSAFDTFAYWQHIQPEFPSLPEPCAHRRVPRPRLEMVPDDPVH